MSSFVVVMNIVRIFIDTTEIEYVFIAKNVFQYFHICRIYADLVIVGTDDDFNRGVMFPADLIYFL